MRSKRTSHPFSAWLSPKLWNLAPSIISARSSIDSLHHTGAIRAAVRGTQTISCVLSWSIYQVNSEYCAILILYYAVRRHRLLIRCPGSSFLWAFPSWLSQRLEWAFLFSQFRDLQQPFSPLFVFAVAVSFVYFRSLVMKSSFLLPPLRHISSIFHLFCW